MLVVVSPAKKLNMSLVQGLKVSEPYFKKNVDELVNVVRDLSVKELKKLLTNIPKIVGTVTIAKSSNDFCKIETSIFVPTK